MKSTVWYGTLLMFALLFSGCGKTEKTHKHYDGEVLIKQKCAACHNLDMPPKISDDEKAPPMYTVTVHLRDWMKGGTTSEKEANFVAFVQSYVLSPSKEKSYCIKEVLQQYGLMPSQKGNVTKEELGAIARYALSTYDQKKLLEMMKEQNRIAAMKPYEQVLALKDCKLCHINGNGKVGPLFSQIAAKYTINDLNTIKDAIVHGSKGRWPNYHMPMRAYKDLTPKQLDGIAKWILLQKK